MLPTHTQQQPDVLLQLVVTAIERGASIEALERLVQLKITADAHTAADAYRRAKAEALAECSTVAPNATAMAGRYSYRYATIDHILTRAGTVFARHGFSWAWDYDFLTRDDGAIIAVEARCTLTHTAGHSETSRFLCPVGGSDRANLAHAVASARSYASRYAWIAVTGIAVGNEDDDAAALAPEQAQPQQQPQQAAAQALTQPSVPSQGQQQGAPTERQLQYLRDLCERTGYAYTEPQTYEEASALIAKLKTMPPKAAPVRKADANAHNQRTLSATRAQLQVTQPTPAQERDEIAERVDAMLQSHVAGIYYQPYRAQLIETLRHHSDVTSLESLYDIAIEDGLID
jgi:hypothetical protein